MLASLRRQYDPGSYVEARITQRWRQVTQPSRYRGDQARLARIDALGVELESVSDAQLKRQVEVWKRRLAGQPEPDFSALIEPAFALLREASRRTTGLFHHPEQILAGLALARGAVAEMATGEGKTLVVTLPSFLFALHGRGVHVVTVNSYLAERDFEFAQPLFEFLGMSIAHLPEQVSVAEKRVAYGADITYGVGYEYGFDYLRDHLTLMRQPSSGPGEDLRLAILGREKPKPEICQRGLAYAIIDEVDSVLIDEAGSPLLISEKSAHDSGGRIFESARDMARSLTEEMHYEVEKRGRKVTLTEAGLAEIFTDGMDLGALRRPWPTYVTNALKADHVFERDVDYVVDEGKVMIVDEFTGRRFADRSWREGQHQAVEAKESVEISPESESTASITRQRFYRLYDTVCGLTGTAEESAGEMWQFFKLPVADIPLHKPSRREILPERIFVSQEAQHRAIVEDIRARRESGQPILVGTRTIQATEAIAEQCREAGIETQVLNAKFDAEESVIISRAGDAGQVTIATNMAGRGTHIGLSDGVKSAGGLHVIVVERNESSRIDRQLIGRGARQGQPGSAQSFVSADDAIFAQYAPEVGDLLKAQSADKNGELSGRLRSIFDRVQAIAEKVRYESRLRMAKHDEWLEDTKSTISA